MINCFYRWHTIVQTPDSRAQRIKSLRGRNTDSKRRNAFLGGPAVLRELKDEIGKLMGKSVIANKHQAAGGWCNSNAKEGSQTCIKSCKSTGKLKSHSKMLTSLKVKGNSTLQEKNHNFYKGIVCLITLLLLLLMKNKHVKKIMNIIHQFLKKRCVLKICFKKTAC